MAYSAILRLAKRRPSESLKDKRVQGHLPWVAMSLITCLLAGMGQRAQAQLVNPIGGRVVNFKVTVDDPYDIQQLWIGFSPLAVAVSPANANLGYSLTGRLFVHPKVQLHGYWQTSWGRATDHARLSAGRSASINYRPEGERRDQQARQAGVFVPFGALDMGTTIHIIDRERRHVSRIMLTSKKARVMEFSSVDYIAVNSRNRHIWAARLGGMHFASTASINRAMSRQGHSLEGSAGTILTPNGATRLSGSSGQSLPGFNQLYANMGYVGGYVGANYQLIRNVAIKADKFGSLANNIIVSVYGDMLIAPKTVTSSVDIQFAPGNTESFSTEGLTRRPVGFRAGADVYYNQDFGYSVGAEAGVRPGLRGQGAYVMGRFSFPMLAFKIRRQRIANQTNAPRGGTQDGAALPPPLPAPLPAPAPTSPGE